MILLPLGIYIAIIIITILAALLFPTLWLRIKSHIFRIIAGAIALLVVIIYPYITDVIDAPSKQTYSIALKQYFNVIISSIIQNAVFGAFVYAIFSGTIDRWLGHDVTESSQFKPRRFLKEIKKSNDSVIIQETYIRVLVQDHREELIEALKQFFDNHLKKYPYASKYEGNIRVLVLHPFGDDIRTRHQELRGHVEPDQKKFLLATRDLLKTLKDIQGEINKYAAEQTQQQKCYFFEIRISYKKPEFSLYYCDKYASVSYYTNEPCEDAPQLIFKRAKKGMNPVAEKHKNFFEHDWDRGILLTRTYFRLAFPAGIDPNKFQQVVDHFKNITNSTIKEDIIIHLKALSEICQSNSVFALELINHVEIHHRKKSINYINVKNSEHFSILGTGGDDKNNRTINISTIVSILASHITKIDASTTLNIAIVKVGTLAVTGRVGSQTFYETLQSKIHPSDNNLNNNYESIPPNQRKFVDYNENNSTFLPIIYFGYMYRQVLRNARKEFIANNANCIDVFKIIFPLANLTDYKASINGISKKEYLDQYHDIYGFKQKTGIVLRNDRDIDELYHGKNNIYYYKNGERIYHLEKQIDVTELTSYEVFFKEYNHTDHGEDHVKRFFKLFIPGSGITEDIKNTICYNMALFVQLQFLVSNEYPEIERNKREADFGEARLDNLMQQIKDHFFNQSSAGLPH